MGVRWTLTQRKPQCLIQSVVVVSPVANSCKSKTYSSVTSADFRYKTGLLHLLSPLVIIIKIFNSIQQQSERSTTLSLQPYHYSPTSTLRVKDSPYLLHLGNRFAPLPKTNINMSAPVAKASTCCGKSTECVCAKQATCSCGKQSALHCTCDKANTENALEGPRCSCRARPAGQCTCDRASTENQKPTGNACACGTRPADACTCEKAADGGFNPTDLETDFTTKN